MKSIFTTLLVLALWQCSTRQSTSDTSQHTLLSDSAERFLPGIVCSDSLDFNAAFSPDGKIFYFSRTVKGRWKIFYITASNGRWSEPVMTSFGEPDYSEADPFFAPDGALYYISDRPAYAGDSTRDFNIWFVRSSGENQWSAPEQPAGINSDSTEYYVSFGPGGNMYFGSSRPGGYGLEDIYVSRWVNGKYLEPENLGPLVNSPQSDHDPLVSPDETYLIYTSEERSDSHGEADLYYTRFENGSWTQAQNMGQRFNTKTYEYCPNFSPDMKHFFFSSEYDVKYIPTQYLPDW